MTKVIDLTGQQFNKLTVIKKAETKKARGIEWICKCECGTEKQIPGSNLTRKIDPVKSCGCLRRIKTGGRPVYKGACVLCGTNETPRWYKKCIKEGTVCRSCYAKEKLKDDTIRSKRIGQRREWGKNNPYKVAVKTAKSKGMEFTLTEEEYLDKITECHYCGDNLNQLEGMKLDRIDSSKFYTLQNTVGCCRMCNVAKNNHTLETFVAWIKRLKERIT